MSNQKQIEFKRKQKNCQQIDMRTLFYDIKYQSIKRFVYSQDSLEPSLFFLSLLIKYFRIIDMPPQNNEILIIIVLSVMLIFNKNHYFFYLSALQLPNSLFQIVTLILGILNINQVNKLYLFFFCFGYFLSGHDSDISEYYQILIALSLQISIYKQMIFKSMRQNIIYFVGFMDFVGLVVINKALRLTFGYIQNQLYIFSALILVLLTGMGLVIIKIRIQQTQSKPLQKLRNSKLMYLKIIKYQLSISQCLKQLNQHQRECEKIQCYCNSIDIQNEDGEIFIQKAIVNQLYRSALSMISNRDSQRIYLLEMYINFLLKNGELYEAINQANQIPQTKYSYFSQVYEYRIVEKIKQELKAYNYDRNSRKIFEVVFRYDIKKDYLRKQIFLILSQKIQFFKQIGKEEISVKTLEKLGKQLVQKIQSLHKIFEVDILPIQLTNSSFQCRIMYGSYVLLTTNFYEYGEKMIRKCQQSISINSVRQALGMELGTQTIQKNNSEIYNYLSIKNISKKLAKSLNRHKSSLLNEPLDIIIPSYFVSAHNRKFNNWKKSTSKISKILQMFENGIQLPLKINQEKVVVYEFELRVFFNEEQNQMRFQALLREKSQKQKNYFVDIDGKLIYYEGELIQQQIYHPDIVEMIQVMKNDYEKSSSTKSKRLNIEVKSNSYQIVLTYFLPATMAAQGYRPIIQLHFENQNKSDQIILQKLKSNHFNNIQSQQKQAIGVQSISSNKSTQNTMSSITVAILENKIHSYHQMPLRIFIIVAILLSAGFLMIEKQVFVVEKSSQPLKSYSSLFKIVILFNCVMSQYADINLYRFRGGEYIRLFDNIVEYSGQNFVDFSYGRIQNFSISLQAQINDNILGKSDYMAQWRLQQFQRTFPVQVNNLESQYNITLQQFIIKVIVELQNFREFNFFTTLYFKGFYRSALPILDEIKSQSDKIFKQNQDVAKTNNIILTSALIFAEIILIFVYIKMNRDYKKEQFRVYSLLSEIDPKLISKQIISLKYIKQMLYKEQDQPFKKHQKSALKQSKNLQQNFIAFAKTIKQKENLKAIHRCIRDRFGQVDVKDSTIDPNKINVGQGGFFLLIVISIGFILGIVYLKLDLQSYIIETKRGLQFHLSQQRANSLLILQTKILTDLYSPPDRTFQFEETDIRIWIRNKLQDQYNKEGQRAYGIQEAQIQQCIEKSFICDKKHSYSILGGIIKKAILDNYNLKSQKLKIEAEGKQFISSYDLQQIRAQLTLAQQALYRALDISQNLKAQKYKELQEKQSKTEQMVNRQELAFWIMFSMAIGLNIWYLVYLHKKYIRSIIYLTFLNKQMTTSNKRLISFADKLSKQNK